MTAAEAVRVWIPAVPRPFYARSMIFGESLVCECGARFRKRGRQERYERHWLTVHVLSTGLEHPQAEVPVTHPHVAILRSLAG